MYRSLPKAPDCRRWLRRARELELSSDVELKLKWFIYCAEHYYNVSQTCRHFGISRSTFLRWAERFDPHSIDSLEEKSRRPHRVRTSDRSMQLLENIAAIRKEFPGMGKVGVAELMKSRHGIVVSSATVGRIITRFGLFFGETPSHTHKRSFVAEQSADTGNANVVTAPLDKDEPESTHNSLYPLHGLSS
jgi:transposase